jgi:hypothetical protein
MLFMLSKILILHETAFCIINHETAFCIINYDKWNDGNSTGKYLLASIYGKL